jgi:hypothetical protein
MTIQVLLIILLLGPLSAADSSLKFQTPGGSASHSRGSRRQSDGKSVYPQDLLATFLGVVRTNNGKLIRIEDVDKKILEFHATHKTEYYDGDQKIKASEIKAGEQVSIDAKQFPDGELEPVTVSVVRETKKPSSGSDTLSTP